MWNWNGYASLCIFVHPEMMLDNIQEEYGRVTKDRRTTMFAAILGKTKRYQQLFRSNDPRVIAQPIVILTTYCVLSASYKSHLENNIFQKFDWYGVVFDEAYTIKASKSQCVCNNQGESIRDSLDLEELLGAWDYKLIAKYKPVLFVVLPPCTSLLANNLREKGLCFGTKLSGVDLSTKWVVDANECACKIFRLNHPETQIRNEYVEDFLDLIKEWDKLCKKNKQLGDVVYVSKLDGQTNCECRFVVRNNSILG
ncbi:bromo adjacent homology (BAH) domain protein [Artemisia annua]|uniref:Bromo adjacent homology (BAH) domain protein n=1 Tax=Artemisia annua TaxID=35608 RepID=A0A2U1MTA9_ARTAN|nr:bromo adjacent homology (BAH) domain protein [Artemisia annua]